MMMTLEARKMRAMRAARASALRQVTRPESRDYAARANQAERMVMLSLRDSVRLANLAKLKVAAMEATARAEGNDARCTECDTYFNQDEDFTCPLCESQFHWPI
jgi:uncharacterized paraquat-inducible protein A